MKTLDLDRTPVARDVHTYCTKEKIDTWHVVVCHNAQGIVERVKCKSCGSEHRYRPAVKIVAGRIIKKTPSANSPSKTEGSSAALEEQWFAAIKNWGEREILHYNPSQVLNEGDVLIHSAFGKGVVMKKRARKVDVIFRNQLKTLPAQ